MGAELCSVLVETGAPVFANIPAVAALELTFAVKDEENATAVM